MPNKLTVCLITYNHADYIRRALDSILAQKMSFDWDVCIYDDHSTDGTIEILTEYQTHYPDKIKLVVQPCNVGPYENWKQLLKSANSTYIAYMEGDDYWIDEYKLEKQCNLLKQRESVGMVYAQAMQIYPGQSNGPLIGHALNRYTLYLENPIPSPTVVMRNACLEGFFDELGAHLSTWRMGDYPLWFWISAGWELAFIPEPMSAYRVLHNSATRSGLKADWVRNKLAIRRYFYQKDGRPLAALYYWLGAAALMVELAYHRRPSFLKHISSRDV